MNKFSSTFGQVLQIFSKKEFSLAVRETQSERGAKGVFLMEPVRGHALLSEENVWFVSRQKGNANYTVIEERSVPANRSILNDQLITLNVCYSRKHYPHPLRRIEVWDATKKESIVLITNHMTFGATTMSGVYKDCWPIEIFFKTIQQNLRIKTFVGTSANAVMIQIWTALITLLLLKYLMFCSRFGWSLLNLIAMLRTISSPTAISGYGSTVL